MALDVWIDTETVELATEDCSITGVIDEDSSMPLVTFFIRTRFDKLDMLDIPESESESLHPPFKGVKLGTFVSVEDNSVVIERLG